MILILVTGYAIAISPVTGKFIDWIATKIKSPIMVYSAVVFFGCMFSLISWSWIVITAVFARELAIRVEKVDYRLPTTCCMCLCVLITMAWWTIWLYSFSY